MTGLRAVSIPVCVLALLVGSSCSDTESGNGRSLSVGSTLPAPSPPVDLDDGCHPTSPTTVTPDEFGAVNTIPERQEAVSYRVAVTPSTVCPGGSVQVVVRVDNLSSRTVTVSPQLVLLRPASFLGCCEELTLPAKGDVTIVRTVVVPLDVSVGSKILTFSDANPADQRATLNVVAPQLSGSSAPTPTTSYATTSPTAASATTTTPVQPLPLCLQKPATTTVPCRRG